MKFGNRLLMVFVMALTTLGAAGCSGSPARDPITTVDYVDLQRFMGDWYVIANIPTFVEKGAHNAIESYALGEDNRVETTFTFRKDGFDGKQKKYTPTGFVKENTGNAIWGMQFVWPFKGDYRIVYLDEDYSQTVIGRNKRDYVWIMARSPSIPEDDYQAIVAMLAEEGYDVSKIQKVPQRW